MWWHSLNNQAAQNPTSAEDREKGSIVIARVAKLPSYMWQEFENTRVWKFGSGPVTMLQIKEYYSITNIESTLGHVGLEISH